MLQPEHLNPCRRDFDYDYEHEREHELQEYIRHLPAVAVCGKFSPSRRSGGGTGRHVRLRGVCRKACGFKSRPEHFHFYLCTAFFGSLSTVFRTDLGQKTLIFSSCETVQDDAPECTGRLSYGASAQRPKRPAVEHTSFHPI